MTRAAEKLHISQSALSIQIRTLEAQLGQQLFSREGRQLVLTEAGRIVLDYADSIFRTGEDLLNQLAHDQEVRRRILRVGALATLSRNFQIAFLRPLLARKDVELILSSGSMTELLDQVQSHHLDLILTNYIPHQGAGEPWVMHEIANQSVSLVGVRGVHRRGRTIQNLLAKEPLVVPARDCNIRFAFDAWVDRLGIQPNIVAEVSDMPMLRLMACENIGLTLVPPIVVKDELEQGVLREVSEIPSLRETFFALVPKRRFPNPLVKALLIEGIKLSEN